jgi:hypothetical protein
VIVVFALVAGIGALIAVRTWGGRLPLPKAERLCTVQADGRVTLTPGQMANAATIAAVGIRREMPERAVVVALATALQESKLQNLAGGDRDSVGLFQQRPSQGWGTAAEIRDPRYAAGKFYAALTKVRGWETMRITEAAQRVQRSAFPHAYEKWADESAVLTKALLGHATGAVACTVPDKPVLRGLAAASALTEGLRLDWGNLPTTAVGELLGLAVTADDTRAGWRYAHWLVSHAADRGVKRVRFGDLEWTADRGVWTSVAANQVSASGQVVAEVFGDR